MNLLFLFGELAEPKGPFFSILVVFILNPWLLYMCLSVLSCHNCLFNNGRVSRYFPTLGP